MFKVICFFMLISLYVSTAFGQLSINSSGNTTVSGNLTVNGLSAFGTSTSYSYKMRVYYNTNASSATAIYGSINGGNGTLFHYGVQGRATSSSGYTNYGIYGYASGGGVNWAGYFSGNVYTTGTYQSSDVRFKKDIVSLDRKNILSKIGQLKPVSYKFFKETELRQRGLPAINTDEGDHVGLIAQDVEKIFPEFVKDVSHPLEDENGEIGENPEIVTTKAINYQEVTVALLAAVQELQIEVQELKSRLNKK